MLLVREIMYCKPGTVKPMVEKSLAMSPGTISTGCPSPRGARRSSG